MFVNRSILCLSFFALANVSLAQEENLADPDTQYRISTKPCVPGGPPEVYIYKSEGDQASGDKFVNTFGKFVIGPDSDDGTASYWWRGKGESGSTSNPHSDKLKFLRRVEILDSRPDTDDEVAGWLYEATDSTGDKFWLVFGEDRIKTNNRYPVYYSFEEPSKDKFKRWLTMSGTKRL